MKTQIIDSDFKTFDPKDYLNEYYTHIGYENRNLLLFFVKAYRKLPKNAVLLEFGGGPTIYPLISAAPKVFEIHFADFLKKNLNEVKFWKKKLPKAFDWSSFIKRALEIEGKKNVKEKDVKSREELVRKKLTRFLICDAFKAAPLGKKFTNFYDVVNVNFVLDSITSTKKTWKKSVSNISSILKKNGLLVMSALKNASYWRAGNKFFPAVNLDRKEIKITLSRLKFRILYLSSIPAEVINEKSKNYEGYKGMIFVLAKKT